MSLSQICQDALRELPSFEVPDSFVGNRNQTASLALAVARREGKLLAQWQDTWQVITYEETISLQDGVDKYALPAGYRSLVQNTWWDRTQNKPLIGPMSPQSWQRLKSSEIEQVFDRSFRLLQNWFLVHPVPTASEVGNILAYEWVSENWIRPQENVASQDNSGDRSEFTKDTDYPLFDHDLMTQGVKWRILKFMGLDYEEEANEYEKTKASVYGRQRSGRVSYLDQPRFWNYYYPNLPETGFGM